MYTPCWPHGEIKEVFPNIFFVMGTNITQHEGVTFQHSRNMIIVRDGESLTLINTVRLDEKGLVALNALGCVDNIVRIGAFHGRDDAFYLDYYKAKLWGLPGMRHANERFSDIELHPENTMPFADCSVFIFETASFPEGILHIAREGGIIVTCDSLKNWIEADQYFSEECAKMYPTQGHFGPAAISPLWKNASHVNVSDFHRLLELEFKHLLSAHGEPLLNNAHEKVEESVKKAFNE